MRSRFSSLPSALGALLAVIMLLFSQAGYFYQASAQGHGLEGLPEPYIKVSEDFVVREDLLDSIGTYNPVTGSADVLVVFVYFTDVAPSVGLDEIVGRLGDVNSYFSEVSYGKFEGFKWYMIDDEDRSPEPCLHLSNHSI